MNSLTKWLLLAKIVVGYDFETWAFTVGFYRGFTYADFNNRTAFFHIQIFCYFLRVGTGIPEQFENDNYERV